MTARASVPGIQSASTTPVSMSRRDPPEIGTLASVRTPQVCVMFWGPNKHGHVAGSRNRQNSRVFQLEIARIAACRTTEECGVGLALPTRAIDEALTIGCEASGRHGAPAERRWEVFRDAGSGPHRRRRRSKESGGQASARDTAPQSGTARLAGRGCCRALARGLLRDPPQLGRHVPRCLPPIPQGLSPGSGGSACSSDTGTRGCSDDKAGGSAATMAAINEARLSPVNGRRPHKHLEDDAAEREDVGTPIHVTPFDLFRAPCTEPFPRSSGRRSVSRFSSPRWGSRHPVLSAWPSRNRAA